MHLTPERIRAALTHCSGSRKEAAKLVGCSPDRLRKYMQEYREDGEEFPEPENAISRQSKHQCLIEVGQWAENGRTQELCEVMEIRYGKSLVRFDGGAEEWVVKHELAWAPPPDVIADEMRRIQGSWPPGEHRKRAGWGHCGEYEIPQVSIGD